MKVRRITSILLSLLCLCLVLTLVPSTARAITNPYEYQVSDKYSLTMAIAFVKDCTEEDNAVVKLTSDIDLGDSYLTINSGVFTIDLNGYTLSGSGQWVLRIRELNDHRPNVTIKNGTTFGVYAYGSTVTIQGGTITGVTGVYVEASSDLTISGGEISGFENSTSYGVYADSSTVTIEGGRITGGPFVKGGASSYGMFVKNSTVTISGGEISGGENPNDNISGIDCGVYANNSTVTISGENTTISGTDYGVDANNSEVNISGGNISGNYGICAVSNCEITIKGDTTISGTSYGVSASDSEVTIENGTISGNTGIYVHCSTADIKGGEISGTKYAVHASCRNSDEMQCNPASVTISGGTISGTGNTAYGVYVENGSTVNISGGTISGGNTGVYANNNSTVAISGGTIRIDGSGNYTYGVYADNSKVTISGGKIKGYYGVSAAESEVTISGGTIEGYYGVNADSGNKLTVKGGEITGTFIGVYSIGINGILTIQGGTVSGTDDDSYGVYANTSTVTITGGTIVAETCGVYVSESSTAYISGETTISGYTGIEAYRSTLNISGGEISGTNYGVSASNSTVIIDGGKISGTYGISATWCEVTIKGDTTISGGSYGVKAEPISIVNIQGGEISGETGVFAENSTVTISGGTISGTSYGVYAINRSNVTIEGGTIYGTSYGVYANNRNTVTISGGEISGTNYGVSASNSTVIIDGGKIYGALGISATRCKVTIKGDTTISGGGYGVDATDSEVTIQGGEISGDTGVFAFESTVTISGGEISGETYGVYADNSTVTIEGGTISGTGDTACGVYAKNGSTVDIKGGTISGGSHGVYANNSTVEISGGTISGTSYGVFALGSEVNISGENTTISGTSYGVYAQGSNSDESTPSIVTISGGKISNCYIAVQADNSTVTISGGTISHNGFCGVRATVSCDLTISGGEIYGNIYGVDATDSEVTIQGGKISGIEPDSSGVRAIDSPVTIQGGTIGGGHSGVEISNNDLVTIESVTIEGGTISGIDRGVSASNSSVTITGGEISDTTYGVFAYGSSKVTISGGEISGTNADLRDYDRTITLTLAEGAAKGATFPGGITVEGTTLETILDEASGIRYWGIVDGKDVMLNGITGTALTDKGDITVQAVCHHQGHAAFYEAQEDGTHLEFCTNCQNPTGKAAEPHVCDKDTGKCICGIESAEATVTTGETTSYYLTLAEAIAAVKDCTAEDEAVVKPMKDIDLGDSYLNISSGVFTIDLNGKKLSHTNNEYKGLLYITGGSNITISDSSTDKTGKISGTSYGVTAESNSAVTIQGGEISGGVGVDANNRSTVTISGGEISGKTYGVYANDSSTVTISRGKITGTYGIFAVAYCEITIKGDTTISGGSCGVFADMNSTVEISGGTISGTIYGVFADSSTVTISSATTISGTSIGVFADSSTVEISGGTISGESFGVFADSSTVEISGGTISGGSYGVFANKSCTVNISGENTTISGTRYGVLADNSAVTISGEATISGTSIGVFANTSSTVTIQGGTISGRDGVNVNSSTVTISGGEISGTFNSASHGVSANNSSTVTISGGKISDTSYGLYAFESTVKISGGEISDTTYGVFASESSTVTIQGGTISGTTADLRVLDSTITLTLAEGAAKGATFPGGITVDGTTLETILGEGAAYWATVDGKNVMLNSITDYEPTDTALTNKGDITVRAVCDHTGSAHTEATDKADGTHGYICTICQNPATEDHPYHPDHGKCICGAQAVARIGDTYFTDLADAAEAWHIDGGTLTLLTDISHDSGINTNTPDSVLELNGRIFTITADTAVWVTEEATLTIRDSSADGTGKVVASENSPLYNNGGTVVLESGTLTGNWVVNCGTMTINGGSVISDVDCHAVENIGNLTINGGTISSSHNTAIKNHNTGNLTVNGGTISGNDNYSGTISVVSNSNTATDMAVTLNSGTVSGPLALKAEAQGGITIRLTLGKVKLNSTRADLSLQADRGGKLELRLTQVPEEPYTVDTSLNEGILLFGYSSDTVAADPVHYKSLKNHILISKNESGVVYAHICDHSGSQHTTGTPYVTDNPSVTDSHSFVCTVCQLTGYEDHYGGTATCMKPAKCAICPADYGEKNPDNHCGETFLHGEKKATCSAEGYTGDTVCYCGTLMAAGTVIPKLPHTYQDGECTGCGQPDPDVPDDDGEGEPGIPSEPTDPAPSDPTEPAPSDPTEPAPSDPTEPSEPEEPETPATSGIIRLAGKDRYLTGFAIADQLKSNWGVEKFQAVVVAYGKNFPDALTGSYLAAVKQAPILLTESGRDTEVLQYIQENLVSGGKVYILGGTAAVSLDFEKGAADFGYSVERLKGANRFDTNLAILEAAGIGTTEQILIATGKNYADSLSASATGLPMVLVEQELTQAQKDFLAKTSKNFVILGGTGAVSAEVEAQLDAIGDVTRVKGASRYETSVEIAKKFFTGPTAAVLAYAQSFPDGLCGGPLARSLGAPMILTSDDSFAAADAYISGITTGVVCGGSARISDDTVREIFDLSADTPIVKP